MRDVDPAGPWAPQLCLLVLASKGSDSQNQPVGAGRAVGAVKPGVVSATTLTRAGLPVGLPTLATAVQRFPSLGLQASSSSTDSPHGSPASSTADRQLEAAFAASSPDPAAPAYRPPPARVELAACTDVGAAVPRSTHTLNFLVVGG